MAPSFILLLLTVQCTLILGQRCGVPRFDPVGLHRFGSSFRSISPSTSKANTTKTKNVITQFASVFPNVVPLFQATQPLIGNTFLPGHQINQFPSPLEPNRQASPQQSGTASLDQSSSSSPYNSANYQHYNQDGGIFHGYQPDYGQPDQQNMIPDISHNYPANQPQGPPTIQQPQQYMTTYSNQEQGQHQPLNMEQYPNPPNQASYVNTRPMDHGQQNVSHYQSENQYYNQPSQFQNSYGSVNMNQYSQNESPNTQQYQNSGPVMPQPYQQSPSLYQPMGQNQNQTEYVNGNGLAYTSQDDRNAYKSLPEMFPAQRKLRGRIAGGVEVSDATDGQFCWQALVRSRMGNCGGTIVGPRAIITSASCVIDSIQGVVRTTDLNVYSGVVRSANMPVEPILAPGCGRPHTVARVIPHPSFNSQLPANINNDIALIILNEDVDLNQTCNCAVCLTDEEPLIGQRCAVSGYDGSPGGSTGQPGLLKWVTLNVRPNVPSICGAPEDTNRTSSICAGDVKFEGPCQRDRGGPLVCWNSRDSSYYLAGVTASRSFVGCFGGPQLYTKVNSYVEWILSNAIGAL